MGAPVLLGGFAAKGRLQHLLPGAAICLQVDGVPDFMPVDIAVFCVGFRQAIDPEHDAYGRKVDIANSTHPGGAAF